MGEHDSPITFLPLLMTNDTNKFPGFPPEDETEFLDVPTNHGFLVV